MQESDSLKMSDGLREGLQGPSISLRMEREWIIDRHDPLGEAGKLDPPDRVDKAPLDDLIA